VDAFRFGKRPKRIKYKKTGAQSVYFMAGSLERSDENVERTGLTLTTIVNLTGYGYQLDRIVS
jgi:hypothetical protein